MPQVNALREWGDSLPKWDKKDWIKKLSQYIPAKDPKQAELFLKGWLIRSYIQAVNPDNLDAASIVNRWFLILHQNKQDSGKSSFFRWMSPRPEWVKENGLEDNKDGYIALARYLFVLDDELGGLSRVQQHERLKAMISTSKIDVRLPYGKTDVSFARVASFCGSTNNEDIFPSSEGTTRFLLLPLTDESFKWEKYTKDINKVKLWAQVKYLVGTDWLQQNNEEIAKYRNDTNAHFYKDDLETYIVERFVVKSDSDVVVRAGDIMRVMSNDYDLKVLNISRLGQSLKRKFGDRVFGYSAQGQQCRGYKVSVLPITATDLHPKRVKDAPSPFHAKARKKRKK